MLYRAGSGRASARGMEQVAPPCMDNATAAVYALWLAGSLLRLNPVQLKKEVHRVLARYEIDLQLYSCTTLVQL